MQSKALSKIVAKVKEMLYSFAKTVSELLVKYGWKIGTGDEAVLDDKQWRACLIQYDKLRPDPPA